jgi:glucans biosynthesis protein C
MAPTSIQTERYHSLDALRATMMSLGLVLHTAVNYMQAPAGGWPVKDPSTQVAFDLLYYFIHLFRMPVFFVSAGFFAALLYEKKGTIPMLINRAKRVVLPLVLSFLLIIPIIRTSIRFTMNGGGTEGWSKAMEMLTSLDAFTNMHLGHLWFLYYLLILYIAALVAMPVLRLIRTRIPFPRKNILTSYLFQAGALPLLFGLTFITLLPMAEAEMDTSVSLVPVTHILLAYAVFFVWGWLLYQRRDRLVYFQRHWMAFLTSGLSVSMVYLYLRVGNLQLNQGNGHLPGKVLAAISIWLLVFASIGLFLRFFSQPNPRIRYLSDASYWMYLIHHPIVIVLTGLLTGFALPATVKFSLVLSGTLLFCLLTYYLFVRSTLIGVLLNGKRYPRGLPKTKPGPVQAAV